MHKCIKKMHASWYKHSPCKYYKFAYLRHSNIREAIFFLRIKLNTQMRLMPHIAGSGDVEQHHAFCLSKMTFSFSEPTSGIFSSITL